MRVMVLVKASRSSEEGKLPTEESLAEMGRFNDELARAGVLLAGEGLHPSSDGKRVRFSDGTRAVVDGPFPRTEGLIAGFWVWQVKSMDEALEWVRRCPDPMPGEEGELELRPIYELEEFAAVDPTGELRRKEAELRGSLETRSP